MLALRMRQVLVVGLVWAWGAGMLGCGDDEGPPAPGDDAGAPGDGGPHEPLGDESDPLFEPDRLLEIEIELDPADWEVLRHEHHDARAFAETCPSGWPESPYTVFPGTITIDGETVADVGVRKKGFLGSITPERPSLKISFDETVPDRTYLGLSRMTLNNNRQDASQANTCLAYRVFREAGVPAPRCNHARVTVNGQYLGTYSHVESIRRSMLARWFGDDGGNLYEGAVADLRPIWVDDYESKPGNDDDRADLQALIDVLATDGPDLEARLAPSLDVDAFTTFWAAEVLVDHWDGYTGNANNHYLYRDPGNGRFYFLPWGPDSAFGQVNPFVDFEVPTSLFATTILPSRLHALPEARARYQARLLELLDRAWDEDALLAEVDRIEQMLVDHIVVDPDAFAADLERIREFIRGRRAAIEADVARDPEWPGELRASPCLRQIGTASGTFSSAFGSFPAANPFTAGTGTLELTLNGTPEVFTDYGVSAGPVGGAADRQLAVGVIGLREDYTFMGAILAVEPSRYEAGAVLDVDMYGVQAQLVEGEGLVARPRAFALGTLRLDEVEAFEGGTVSGRFDLDLWWL